MCAADVGRGVQLVSFHAQALAICGPKPPGNPDQMLENAGRMVSIVAEMESQASALASAKVAGSGLGVSAANSGTASDAGKLRSAASALQAAASTLRTAAGDLQDKQDAWAKRVKLTEGRLEHEFRLAQAAAKQ